MVKKDHVTIEIIIAKASSVKEMSESKGGQLTSMTEVSDKMNVLKNSTSDKICNCMIRGV